MITVCSLPRCAALVSLTLLFLPEADAQLAPVRLSVAKKQVHHAQKTSVDVVSCRTGQKIGKASETVSYNGSSAFCHIEVFNNTAKALKDVKIQWSLLLTTEAKEPKLVSGEQAATIEVRKKHSFKTDRLELQGEKFKDVAYRVEVFVAGEKVASEIEPRHAEAKFEELVARK